MIHEITTLSVRFGAAGPAIAGLDAFMKAPETQGRLMGCWTSEIGTLNRVVILRAYDDEAAMLADRARLLAQTDPFAASGGVTSITFETYAVFPWFEPLAPGEHGRVWEMRTYKIKHGGVGPTVAAWEKAVPARAKISPLAFVGYALDGEPRTTHFWPYDGYDDRFEKRARSVAEKVWPPIGGPDWLTGDMVSTMLIPAAISPWK